MHHNVRTAGSRLIGRQGIGTLWVHDTETASAQVAVDTPLDGSLVLRNDATARHLAASSRYGEHHTDGQTLRRNSLPCPEVPHIAFITHTITDGLGRIDDAATTYSQDEVHSLRTTEGNAFLHLRQQRVRHYPTQLHKGYTCLVEQGIDLVQQA